MMGYKVFFICLANMWLGISLTMALYVAQITKVNAVFWSTLIVVSFWAALFAFLI